MVAAISGCLYINRGWEPMVKGMSHIVGESYVLHVKEHVCVTKTM